MDTNSAFWRDLEAKFRALPDPAGRLIAMLSDGQWHVRNSGGDLLVAAGEQEDLRPFFAPRERWRPLGCSAIPMSQNGRLLGQNKATINPRQKSAPDAPSSSRRSEERRVGKECRSR